jgi:hypothetical protein
VKSILELDMQQKLGKQARPELLSEARKHAIPAKLRQVPYPRRPNDNSQDRFLKTDL